MKSLPILVSSAFCLTLAAISAPAQPPTDPRDSSEPQVAGAPDNNQRPRRPMGPGEMRPGQMGPGQMGHGPQMMHPQSMKEELGLTDSQQTDIRKTMEGARRDRLRKSTDLKIAKMDLHSLMRADKVDEKAVAAKLAEVQAASGALIKLRVDSALAMKRILTPEQQKKFAEMRAHHRMNGRMNRANRMNRNDAPGGRRGQPRRGGRGAQNPPGDDPGDTIR